MNEQDKIVKMEDILNRYDVNKDEEKAPLVTTARRSRIKENVPRGKPKSGRIWKSEKKKFSSIIKTKGIKKPYAKKEALRKELQKVKEFSRSIKAKKEEEKELKKQRRRENLKKQEENRKKSEIVQVITNTTKLKRLKKKHLRGVEKRDTTNL